MAEHARREALARGDHAGARGRVGELGPHDRLKHEVAERAPALPALEPLLGDDALWAGSLSAAQVVSSFASVGASGVTLDFGGGTISPRLAGFHQALMDILPGLT